MLHVHTGAAQADPRDFCAHDMACVTDGQYMTWFERVWRAQVLELPPLNGRVWQQLADTSKLAPYDFLQADEVCAHVNVRARWGGARPCLQEDCAQAVVNQHPAGTATTHCCAQLADDKKMTVQVQRRRGLSGSLM